MLAAYDDPQLFTPQGIARLRALTARLDAMPGVASATSLGTLLGDRVVDPEGNPLTRRLLDLMEGYAVGADRRTAGVVCVLEPPAPAVRTPRTGRCRGPTRSTGFATSWRKFPRAWWPGSR